MSFLLKLGAGAYPKNNNFGVNLPSKFYKLYRFIVIEFFTFKDMCNITKNVSKFTPKRFCRGSSYQCYDPQD